MVNVGSRLMLLVFLSLAIVHSALFQQFNVYYTNNDQPANNFDQSMYDCLHYYVKDDIIPYKIEYNINKYDVIFHTLTYQIIQYCFRPSEKSQYNSLYFPGKWNTNFTFYQLRSMNVSSQHLYSWSAPINLVEQYQIYLNGNDSLFETIFYNCTQGWFGPSCRYSFGFKDKSLSFADIVKGMFILKKNYREQTSNPPEIFGNLSCYIHVQCNRGGPFPACLDWREICDGKVDCIDGGLDEKDCEQLEINECNDNEYRCDNGPCIPEEFLWDNSINPECLDGTDETVFSTYTEFCPYDPSFRCENLMCRPSLNMKDVVCGDGLCVEDTHECVNKRDELLKIAMIESTSSLSDECRDIMVCFTGLKLCQTVQNITEHCPKLFQFPEIPVLFGHVKFVYKNDLFQDERWGTLMPTYVCYDALRCSIPSLVQVSNYSACLPIDILRWIFITNSFSATWGLFIQEVKTVFYKCSIVSSEYCSHNDTFYTCNSTSKCISNHRLLDGIEDCFFSDDEKFGQSCLLNNSKHRLVCDHKCLSPITRRNHRSYCSAKQDEQSPYDMQPHKNIYFQTVCDGFVELSPPLIINERNYSDETECDIWPCNNSYTRCNGFWNCLNGEDEMNCPPSTCPLLRHISFATSNTGTFCKTVEKAADTIIDCRSSPDEQLVCQNWTNYFMSEPYWCTMNVKCIQPTLLCVNKPKCVYNTDEKFCTPEVRPCIAGRVPFETNMERFLCDLTGIRAPIFVPFALKNSRVYPKTFQMSNTEADSVSIEQRLTVPEKTKAESSKKILTWFWRCNRGLDVQISFENNKYDEGCLCPPSYYGDLCQYQNQRVSLTLQVRVSSDWSTMFEIILTLIDNEEQIINSYDQIQYLPIRDCNTKFNVYFLYSTRPKNISKNYSIRISVFNKHSLKYRASWLFPILFPFLPVNRMSLQIIVPIEPVICHLDCGINGQCSKYENTGTYFCHCNYRWSGSQCNVLHACECSTDALCIGPSICLCPLEKFGLRCYLNRTLCPFDSCMNGGTCISSDARIVEENITCICREGFSGEKCQFSDSRIDITFHGMAISPFILIHFITVFDNNKDRPHTRSTTFNPLSTGHANSRPDSLGSE